MIKILEKQLKSHRCKDLITNNDDNGDVLGLSDYQVNKIEK